MAATTLDNCCPMFILANFGHNFPDMWVNLNQVKQFSHKKIFWIFHLLFNFQYPRRTYLTLFLLKNSGWKQVESGLNQFTFYGNSARSWQVCMLINSDKCPFCHTIGHQRPNSDLMVSCLFRILLRPNVILRDFYYCIDISEPNYFSTVSTSFQLNDRAMINAI